MTTTRSSSTKGKRSRAAGASADDGANGSRDAGSGLSALINSGLTSSFDAIREKIAATVGDNGEEYLHDAVEKITDSTAQIVSWCKKNPIKMVIGVAALTAVSAFLVHTMGASATPLKRLAKKGARLAKAAAVA